MAPSWFLILLLKCFDFLSWPVLALGYPLCASIKAIESDNHSEIRNLMSYWILLSLIYLFEYPFLKLLQWFHYWHYMKLMMVAFLVMPDFGRAAYVYMRLIRSCIYMNPEAVLSRFRNSNNISVKKQDFTVQAEKYVSQNGTEALEKLIASKNTEQSRLLAETRKAVPITTEKNEILKTNEGRLLTEETDIKDLEMIEKEDVPEGKQDNTALDRPKSNESTSSAMVKTEKMPADRESGIDPQISASENVQKEWTCAICQLTMPSEANLNSHLQGRKHKAACEALNTKTKVTSAIEPGTGAPPQVSASTNIQKTWTCEICQTTIHNEIHLKHHIRGRRHKAACEALDAKINVTSATKPGTGASPQVLASNNVQTTWTCEICQMAIHSEVGLNSHIQGRKHKAACKALNAKIKGIAVKTDTRNGASPKVPASKIEQTKWICDICQMTMPSKSHFKSHLKGKKHKAACEALLNTNGQPVAERVLPKKNEKSIGEQDKIIFGDLICHLN